MSVRNEPNNTANPAAAAASLGVPMTPALVEAPTAAATAGASIADDHTLAEANTFNTTNVDHPLSRSVVVNIRASLNDLCLKKSKATWAPSSEAVRSILQQRRFTDLSGASESQGDLKSVVLHKLTVDQQANSFPIAVGTKVVGVDDNTYSLTGEAFSSVALPQTSVTTSKTLQEDDVTLAYEFARKFPGYTSDNLHEKGIHEVQARRFCLVAADHPLVSAISENADKLQMGEISMMPEGLVKISSSLYQTILPMVRSQVAAQIKVKDMSKFAVSIAPAEYASWQDARNDLMSEAKSALRAKYQLDAGAQLSAEKSAAFDEEELALEHAIDHKVHTFSATLAIDYNFLSA